MPAGGKVAVAATASEPAVPSRADLCPKCSEEFIKWWRAKL